MTALPPLRPERRERRRFGKLVLVSLAFHAVLAFLAGLWIVSRPWHRPRPPVGAGTVPVFQVAAAAKASSSGGAASSSAAPLPALPDLLPRPVAPVAAPALAPAPAPVPMPMAMEAQGAPTASAAENGAGNGTGAGGNGNSAGTGTGFSLLGLDGGGNGGMGRVVIALDVSPSMFVRQPGAFDRIVAETLRAIDGLDAASAFDLIVFEDGALAWQPELVPPGDARRREAKAWLENVARLGPRFSARAGKGTVLFEGGGSRGDTALRQAFSLHPDRIVVLTDGQWHQNPLSGDQHVIGAPELAALTAQLQQARQADGGGPARIDVVFLSTARTTPGESAAARALAEGNGGQWIEVKAADLVAPQP